MANQFHTASYELNRKHLDQLDCPGHIIYADRTDSFRATITPDVVYAERHRPLHLQIMRLLTTEKGKKYPLILYVQGSGYRKQDVWRPLPQLAPFVHEGYVVATLEYRFTDEGGLFPQQVQDLNTGIRFLKKHAQEYQIDPDRVALWGDSSGGHTVALAAITQGDPFFQAPDDDLSISTVVKCVIDFYGVYDIAENAESISPELIAYFEGNPVEKLFGGPLKDHQDMLKKAQLANQLEKANGKEIPPFLLVHGTEDPKVSFSQSVRFFDDLKTHHVPCDFYAVMGAGHGNRIWIPETIDVARRFLRAYV